MSLTPAQARIIANTEPFTTILRETIQAILPLIQALHQHRQRHRSRVVTRNKQRRHW